MKLFHSTTSPYVRKVLACAIAREIDAQIQTVPTNPHVVPPELAAANPLSKVPCLVTVDGLALFDSPVICEYLDSLGDAPPMFPHSGGARWLALRYQALGDGMLDAAIGRRLEMAKPAEAGRAEFMGKQAAVVRRSLDDLERAVPHPMVDIGSISVACALGYLDFRYGAEPWREGRALLAGWYAAFAENSCMARTAPHEQARPA